MDEILRRLGAVEAAVSDIKSDVSALKATSNHLATKNDVSSLESKLIRWCVGTAIAVAALAFTIARFVVPTING